MICDCNTNKVFLAEGLKCYGKVYENLLWALNQEQIQVELLPLSQSVKHIWVRDYMPLQIDVDKYLVYRYSPDYLAKSSEYIPDYIGVCKSLIIKYITTDIILDGGNVGKCGNRVIMTDKIFLENPNYTRNELIGKLEELLGAEVVIIPWDRFEMFGHSDGMVRYIGNNKVLLNNYTDFDKVLRKRLLVALTPHFEVLELEYGSICSKNSWAYLNFLQTESCILVPGLGLKEDVLALEQIKLFYPDYDVVQIAGCEEIVKEGGALNCISWNVK